jgi:hypothetical protein
VITRADIVERVIEWGLTEEVVEKDYVLGWLLWGIGTDPVLSASWVFKGGTCLKKCYIETHRFSEDLDFTALPGRTVPYRSVPRTLSRCCSRRWHERPRSPASTSRRRPGCACVPTRLLPKAACTTPARVGPLRPLG